jgi:hypothetical protein
MKALIATRLFFALVFFAILAPSAHADGRERYVQDGNVKVRFYFDAAFLYNQFVTYDDITGDFMDSLYETGIHGLGLKYVRDTSNYDPVVDMGTRQIWTPEDLKAWVDQHLPLQTGVVKVLLHFRAVTFDGICHDDVPGDNFSSYAQGDTWRGNPSKGGGATAQVTLTAKLGCSVNSSAKVSQLGFKSTFIHEMGHAVGSPDLPSSDTRCKTKPIASIMCSPPAPGVTRVWTRWFPADVTTIRTFMFGANSKNPRVSCYEWSSAQACSTNCVNVAGYPSPSADLVYQNCMTSQCANICR